MSATVLVIGGGIAGFAAAATAKEAGADVSIALGRAGATFLSPGVLDFAQRGDASPLTQIEKSVFSLLDGYVIEPTELLTIAGTSRTADGRDETLLSVSALQEDGAVAVIGRTASFDSRYLAKAFSATTKRSFVALACDAIQRYADERHWNDAELASRFDEEERLAWLARILGEGIQRSTTKIAGVLLPNILGTKPGVAARLSAMMKLPCGEVVGTSNTPGFRFLEARDRALARAAIPVRRGDVEGIDFSSSGRVRVTFADHVADVSRVVVATGGIVGDGLRYVPSEIESAGALPLSSRATFEPSFRTNAPLPIIAPGIADRPSSLFGEPAETFRLSLTAKPSPFLRAGFDRRALPRGILVAGAAAGEGTTWLEAFRSGCAQGSNALI